MSWLGSIAKTANYLYHGGSSSNNETEEETKTKNIDDVPNQEPIIAAAQNTNTNNTAAHAQPDFSDPKTKIYCSAKGELWKFSPKREQFKLKARQVTGQIIVSDDDPFSSSFQILNHNGNVLFCEPITNDLQIQFNKNHHSMVFTYYLEAADQLSILSFIFGSQSSEDEFKSCLAIKLFEHNRQESFEKLLKQKQVKEQERSYIQNSFEIGQNTLLTDDVDVPKFQPLADLDEDVQMVDTAGMDFSEPEAEDDVPDEAQDDDGDQYEEDNKWQQAADSYKPSVADEMDANTNTRYQASNKLITGSKLFNRAYVVRETGANQSALGFMTHNAANELEYQGKIMITDKEKQSFTPQKVLQHKSDTKMLMLNDNKPGAISVLDLHKGSVVEEWDIRPEEYGGLHDISSLTKHDATTDNPLLYGLNAQSMFLIDSRLPDGTGNDKLVQSKMKTYKTKTGLSCIATSGQGFIATGSNNGMIRLHDTVEKRAKTRLCGLGDSITAIEVSNNGEWILATCKDYILVIPTVVPGCQRTGFEGRGMLNIQKPNPYVLRLRFKDIQKFQLRNVSFTAAHFDAGNEAVFDEQWIVTSTGPYIIKWDFRKLKYNGVVNSYSIRKAHSKIVHNEFRFNHGDDLLVTEQDSVYAQHSTKK